MDRWSLRTGDPNLDRALLTLSNLARASMGADLSSRYCHRHVMDAMQAILDAKRPTVPRI